MWKTLPLPIVLVLTGCQEYEIVGEPAVEGVPNPAVIETPIQVDTFRQVQKPEVDILWVVDNSGSMQQEQDAVAANFSIFMDFFLGSGLDYHMGVVSTDMEKVTDSGKLQQASGLRWIDEATQNPVAVFEEMFVLGTGGSSDERGREAAYTAMELLKDTANAGFMRDDSAVHVVVVADETDMSVNTPISKAEYIQYLNNLRDDPDMVTFSSIVTPEPPIAMCATASTYGGYIDITQAVGGVLWSVCNPDWGTALEQLGLATSGLKREYFLSRLPVPGTITVSIFEDDQMYSFEEYDESAQEGDWTYDSSRNSITFVEYIPNPLSEVQISYELLAGLDAGQ